VTASVATIPAGLALWLLRRSINTNRLEDKPKKQKKMKLLTKNLVMSGLVLFAVTSGGLQAYSQPVVPAPTPTLPQGQVIAVYNSSATYTNIPVPAGYFNDWYNPGGGGAGFYAIEPSGSTVLYYPAPIVIWGIDFSANPYNMSGCTNMHVDVYAPNATNYDIRIVNTVQGQQADAIGPITPGGWVSLNIPYSAFTSNNPAISFADIGQVGIVGDGGSDSTYYIDNIYFAAGTNLVLVPPPAAPAPTNNAPTPVWSAGNVLALFDSSGIYPEAPFVDWPAPWSNSPQTPYTITNTGNVVEYLSGLTYVGEDFYNPQQVNITGFNTMHVDLWTANGNQFYIQLVSLDNGGTQSAQVEYTSLTTNQWNSLDIPLSQFTNANAQVDLTDIQQILWVDNIGTGLQKGNFYFDNVYFYNRPASVPVTATINGGTRNLSFPTQNGFNYTVQYTTSLKNPVWQTVSSVSGNGSTQIVPDVSTQSSRFYRLSVQ
jgi:hypothetical protein